MSCHQVNIPTTDNSEIPCESTISAKCVFLEPAILYLGLPADSSMESVILAMTESLIDARNRITELENP